MSANLMSLARVGDRFLKLYGDRKIVKPLPYLRRVAYLESHGTEYINTGKYPYEIGAWELDLKYLHNATVQGFNGVFAVADQRFDIGTSGTGMWALNLGSLHYFGEVDNDRHVFKLDNETGNVSIDEDSYNRGIVRFDSQRNYPITIAARFYYGHEGLSYFCTERIFESRMLKSGSVIQDLIPVLDLSGRPSMYDEVSGQFFYNQGTGEFTWGELDSQTT